MRLNRIVLLKFKHLLSAWLVIIVLAAGFWPIFEQNYLEVEIAGVKSNQDYAFQIWQDKELRLLLPPPQ